MATVTIDPGLNVHVCVWFAIHLKFFPYECHQYQSCYLLGGSGEAERQKTRCR